MKSLAALLGELPTHNLVRPGADNPPRPFVVILEQATKSKGAAAGMTCVLIITIYCSIAEVMTSSSRLTAAFARQGGVPFSSTYVAVFMKLHAGTYDC